MNFYKKLLSVAFLGAFLNVHSAEMPIEGETPKTTVEYEFKGETIKILDSHVPDINIEDGALADYFLTSLSNFTYYTEKAVKGELNNDGLSTFLAEKLEAGDFKEFSEVLYDLKEEMLEKEDNTEIKEKVEKFRSIILGLNDKYDGKFLKSFENCILSHTYSDYIELLDAVVDAL